MSVFFNGKNRDLTQNRHRTWQMRRVVYTDKIIGFTRVNDDQMIDVIVLSDLEDIEEMLQFGDDSTFDTTKRPQSFKKSDKSTPMSNTLRIDTSAAGYNLGRSYYLKCETSEICCKLVSDLKVAAKLARDRESNSSTFEKSKKIAQDIFHSIPFQSFTGVMIVAVSTAHLRYSAGWQILCTLTCVFANVKQNFITSIAESEADAASSIQVIAPSSKIFCIQPNAYSRDSLHGYRLIDTMKSITGNHPLKLQLISGFGGGIEISKARAAAAAAAATERWQVLNILFTAVFAAELLLNAYAHWLREFLTNGW